MRCQQAKPQHHAPRARGLTASTEADILRRSTRAGGADEQKDDDDAPSRPAIDDFDFNDTAD